jgi:HEAT repeat protein
MRGFAGLGRPVGERPRPEVVNEYFILNRVANALSTEANSHVRLCAAEALGSCGAHAVPLLLLLLNDRDDTVRYWAAISLGHLGPAASNAVPALEIVRSGADEELRQAASLALERIHNSGTGPKRD